MPFTPAHVLAVVPGVHWHRRLRLDPTCLVIGSMTPDFEYFARGAQTGSFSHTLLGLVAFGIPVTLLVALLYDRVVKWPALLVAPAALTPVLGRPWDARWSSATVASAVVSAAIGDVTHITWDGLTHSSGIFVRWVPALATVHDVPVLGTMALHRILQHASTLVGLCGLAWYLVHLARRAPRVAPDVPRARARIAFAICLGTGGALSLLRLAHRHSHDVGGLVVGAISGMLAGAILASLLVREDAGRYRAQIEPALAD